MTTRNDDLSPPVPCPLCQSGSAVWYEGRRRHYLRCPGCSLIFVPPHMVLSRAAEQAEYEKHQNSPSDPGYRSFLGALYEPVSRGLAPGSRGLDYGCGPGPTLSVMFEEGGHHVALYDPFFQPDLEVFAEQYDFVTCSEVIEHCLHPMTDLERMWQVVRPGGTLGLMTGLVTSREAFANWHYIRERSHIRFFSEATFRWVGERLGALPEFVGDRVVLFTKSQP